MTLGIDGHVALTAIIAMFNNVLLRNRILLKKILWKFFRKIDPQYYIFWLSSKDYVQKKPLKATL